MNNAIFENSSKTIREFLVYMETIRGKSPKTVDEYGIDLRTFFRFMKKRRGLCPKDMEFEKIDVQDVSVSLISSVTLSDIYEYLLYLSRERKNGASTRARKISSLRSFYKYACDKAGIVRENPTVNLETPKTKKALPKYLSLNECEEFLRSIDGPYRERDYCIITLFLNCGMRLSELVGLNISDIRGDRLTVTGKGNKERNIYINEACEKAIENYLKVRPRDGVKSSDKDALFLSRLKSRISPKTVQWTVKKFLSAAGLSGKGYSVHKLRHTAATLMYQDEGVDVRVLQEILGHESLKTTEIYTHMSSGQAKKAIINSPLAHFDIDKDEKE